MIRLLRWMILGAAGFALSAGLWSDIAAAQGPKAPVRHAHVYLLRGFMNVFSLGMDELAAKIVQRGIYATVDNHAAWASLASEAAANYRAGREGPIVIIGHSLGADAAIEMADALARQGVPVKLVVTFDPVAAEAADGDIAKVVNLYISNGWGVPVRRGPRFRGTLINLDLRGRADVGHIFIDKSAALHQQVLGYVLQAVARDRVPPAPSGHTPPAGSAQQADPSPTGGAHPGTTKVTAAPPAASETAK